MRTNREQQAGHVILAMTARVPASRMYVLPCPTTFWATMLPLLQHLLLQRRKKARCIASAVRCSSMTLQATSGQPTVAAIDNTGNQTCVFTCLQSPDNAFPFSRKFAEITPTIMCMRACDGAVPVARVISQHSQQNMALVQHNMTLLQPRGCSVTRI